ncbi:MAG TPA: hypothetical protein VGE37_17075, partial [Archangium sp.]
MLRSGAWAVFVFAVGVFGCGCDFSTAHRISGDRAVRCRAQRPDVPSGFPVVIQQRVIRPVANGLLADDELMHIEDETVSIQRLPSGVSAAAWSGASSIVADDEGEISLWQDQIHPCARSSDVLSVGLDGDAVFWTNWNEPQRTV